MNNAQLCEQQFCKPWEQIQGQCELMFQFLFPHLKMTLK